MITITDTLKQNIPCTELTGFAKEDLLFFDIETTGFAPEHTTLYMIGCIYYQQGNLMCTQFFTKSKDDEPTMLNAFFDLVKNRKAVITYNGEGFDIPYLLKKCRQYNLLYSFENIVSIDLYKAICSFKNILSIDNLKQKSVEQFLGINREDKFSGGKLINVYTEYQKNNSKELFDMLMLHNKEDIIYLTSLMQMLAYPALMTEKIMIKSVTMNDLMVAGNILGKEIDFVYQLSVSVPRRISFGKDNFYITIYGDEISLKVKAHTDELKYFYPNYKDYYYLPEEDTAIHKSVAFYVDKNFRTKAKAANCYSKKTGVFLPQYSEVITPYFKIDYYDKITYFEFTDDFRLSNDNVVNYVKHLIEFSI